MRKAASGTVQECYVGSDIVYKSFVSKNSPKPIQILNFRNGQYGIDLPVQLYRTMSCQDILKHRIPLCNAKFKYSLSISIELHIGY